MDARKFADALAQRLADDGKLVEAGWVALQAMAISPVASKVQRDEMRMAYFAGAQHLFSSIMSILDPGSDQPTERDLARMDLIDAELIAFATDLEQRFGGLDGRKPT